MKTHLNYLYRNDTKMITNKLYTLIFLKCDDKLLLGKKTRGFGIGLWNGFGGKLEPNETIEDGAKRELQEESNVIADELKQLGLIRYEVDKLKMKQIVHVFTCTRYHGQEQASEEMNPIRWFNSNDLPFKNMWSDFRLWHQFLQNDQHFYANVIYNEEGQIKNYCITQHDRIDDVLNGIPSI